jgi:hypothetical protein
MAMVPTHEIEMYENMDLIEHLDDLQAMDDTTFDVGNEEDSI